MDELGAVAGDRYPSSLAKRESDCIVQRRGAAKMNAPEGAWHLGGNGLPDDTVGIALSGGGIRSATFCLGVFRALARQGLIGRVDFLSTVSGGGYFGSFLGGLYVPRPLKGSPAAKVPTPAAEEKASASKPATTATMVDQVSDILLDSRSQPVDWLRENGRYMSPNGAGDTLLAGAALLRNWVAVILVVSSFLFTLFSAAAWLADVSSLAIRSVGSWEPAGLAAVTGGIARAAAGTGVPAGTVALSPFLALPVALFLVAVVPLGWAFWFTQHFSFSARGARFPPSLFAAGLLVWVVVSGRLATGLGQLLAFESAAALAWWGLGAAVAWSRGGSDTGQRLVRNLLSRWLSTSLWTAVAVLVFALIDSIGLNLADGSHRAALWRAAATGASGLLGVFAIAQKALPLLGAPGRDKRLSFKPGLLAGVAAGLVVTGLLVGLSAAAHAVASKLGAAALCGVLVTVATAWTLPFLNLSSHNSLYGARLTRAYLGASNRNRSDERATVTELVPGDQVGLADYDTAASGGPLHLINVTLNETVSGKSQIEQRDRKGMTMAVGPCGVSVGGRHHALWGRDPSTRRRGLTAVAPAEGDGDFQIFPPGVAIEPEELDLGAWISVSGAAFSTGLGARTSLSLSLLLGLANVRLGHWWDCGISPTDRKRESRVRETVIGRTERWLSQLLPVHSYLLDELLARFHGPDRRRWYLSDGGHSENTGAYELIRRRVPFIVICDDGCDPDYRFEDIGNLTRRVRTDLGAELAVFTRDQLNDVLPKDLSASFGSIEDFDPARRTGRPHALLAGVFYDDPQRQRRPGSVIVILKPSLSGDEPPDVVEYGMEHNLFPQEPTSDQFFDEAQWESYRRLGEHIASRVFEDVPGTWRPLDFRAPALAGIRWRGARRELASPAGLAAGDGVPTRV